MRDVLKQYSQEFKQDAVRLITEDGMFVAQTVRICASPKTCCTTGKKEMSQLGAKAFLGHGQPIEAELASIGIDQVRGHLLAGLADVLVMIKELATPPVFTPLESA